jgi:hypothetical protein
MGNLAFVDEITNTPTMEKVHFGNTFPIMASIAKSKREWLH